MDLKRSCGHTGGVGMEINGMNIDSYMKFLTNLKINVEATNISKR